MATRQYSTMYKVRFRVTAPNGGNWQEYADIGAASFTDAKKKLKAKGTKNRKRSHFVLVAKRNRYGDYQRWW